MKAPTLSLISCLMLLSACSEEILTTDYLAKNPDRLQKVLKECNDKNLSTPTCSNAREVDGLKRFVGGTGRKCVRTLEQMQKGEECTPKN